MKSFVGIFVPGSGQIPLGTPPEVHLSPLCWVSFCIENELENEQEKFCMHSYSYVYVSVENKINVGDF